MAEVRYERLNQVTSRVLKEVAGKLRIEKVESCYPELAATPYGQALLRTAHEQITQQWQELCKQEFEQIFNERQCREKLDELDLLVQEAEQRRESGGPKLHVGNMSPHGLSEQHLLHEKLEYCDALETRLKAVQAANQELVKELRELEEEMKQDETAVLKVIEPLASVDEGTVREDFNQLMELS